jgi:hypothetical protein
VPKNFLFCLAFLIAFSSTHAFADEPEDNGESILDRADYDPTHPYYQSLNPRWALGLRVAIQKFPVPGALGSTFQLYGEYILPFQQIGVFSIGPHVGSFPLYAPETGIPYPVYENAVAGAALRYQLKVTTNQWVVPTMAIEWEYYRIRQNNVAGDNSQLTGSDFGLSAGLMLNLSIFDSVTARDGYQSLGLLRSYLTMELRSANINNALFSLSGNYWLFGLRMEFE